MGPHYAYRLRPDFLLLVIWSLWMSRYQPPQRAATGGDTPRPRRSRSPALRRRQLRRAPPQLMPAAVRREQVVVETDLARYLFDSRAPCCGASSCWLRGVGSEPRRTARHLWPGRYAGALGIDSNCPRASSPAEVPFALLNPRRRRPAPARQRRGQLEFRLQDARAAVLVKRFSLRGDSYDIGLAWRRTCRAASRRPGADGGLERGARRSRRRTQGRPELFHNSTRVGDQAEKKSPAAHFASPGRGR